MPTATKKPTANKPSLSDLNRRLVKLTARVEELEDLRDLKSAVGRNAGKRGVPWTKAKPSIGLV